MNITIPASLLKAASFFADQNQYTSRPYLRGVCLRDGKYIDATNGHIMIRISHEMPELKETKIISFAGQIPAAAYYADIVFMGDSGVMTFRKLDGKIKVESKGRTTGIFFDVIDAKYPDFDKLIADKKEAVEEVGINPEYMAVVGKANKALGVKGSVFHFNGKSQAIKIKPINRPFSNNDVVMLLMPMRAGDEK